MAMKSPDKEHWRLATKKKLVSLTAKTTCHLVPHTSNMRVIGCLWKYKIK
jgi:hypothetical protein